MLLGSAASPRLGGRPSLASKSPPNLYSPPSVEARSLGSPQRRGRGMTPVMACKVAGKPRTWKAFRTSDQAATVLFLLIACVAFGLERSRAPAVRGLVVESVNPRHLLGVCWASVAIIGRPAASALRKAIATPRAGVAVSHAEQVGVTSLLQGLAAVAFLVLNTGSSVQLSLPTTFWICLGSSAFLNAIIKTSETHAYTIGEMSLCAPFLAFDPVIQLAVGSLLLPLLSFCCLGGAPLEPPSYYFLRKAASVACIAAGMLALSISRRQAKRELPKGAGFIILNCFLYSATYRLDAAAVGVTSSVCYFAFSRLLMAAVCFAGTLLQTKEDAKLDEPSAKSGGWDRRTVTLLLFVCVVDAAYMLSMYQAVSLISPVLVSAVKRGGGIVVSALFGALFFGENLSGRKKLLFSIAAGVTKQGFALEPAEAGDVQATGGDRSLLADLRCALPPTLLILTVVFLLPLTGSSQVLRFSCGIPGLHAETLLLFALATPVQCCQLELAIFAGLRHGQVFILSCLLFHQAARRALKRRSPNMDVLISTATCLAYGYSTFMMALAIVFAISGETQEEPPPHFFETPCTLVTVVLIGRLLESGAKQRTTTSLDAPWLREVFDSSSLETSGIAMAARLPPVKRQENVDILKTSLQNRRSHFRPLVSAELDGFVSWAHELELYVVERFVKRRKSRSGTSALQLTCERRESLDLPKNPFGDTAFELPDPENRRHPRSCQMPETPDTAALAFDHRELVRTSPPKARLVSEDAKEPRDIATELVALEDLLEVPADGELSGWTVDGGLVSAAFDESLLTGESRPVPKAAGDTLIGGSRLVTGRAVRLRAKRVGSGTALQQIVSLVERAAASAGAAPAQRLADAAARFLARRFDWDVFGAV
eukprot:s301_g20.t3